MLPLYYIVLTFIAFACYGPFIARAMRFRNRKNIRVEFFRAVLHELDNNNDNHEVLARIRSCYDDIRYRYENAGGIFTSLGDALGLLYNRRVQRGTAFDRSYGLKIDQTHLNRVHELRKILLDANPFADVSGRFRHFLDAAHRLYSSGNLPAGFQELAKLEQTIKETEHELRRQRDDNRKALVISIIGLVLTITFGLAPLITWLNKLLAGAGN